MTETTAGVQYELDRQPVYPVRNPAVLFGDEFCRACQAVTGSDGSGLLWACAGCGRPRTSGAAPEQSPLQHARRGVGTNLKYTGEAAARHLAAGGDPSFAHVCASPEMPAEWAGTIGIEWPAATPGGHAMSGWGVTLYDADGPVTTVQSITLHAAADSLVWAELTMFATEDGKPVLHTGKGYEPAAVHGGEIAMGTFPFLITSMKVQGG